MASAHSFADGFLFTLGAVAAIIAIVVALLAAWLTWAAIVVALERRRERSPRAIPPPRHINCRSSLQPVSVPGPRVEGLTMDLVRTGHRETGVHYIDLDGRCEGCGRAEPLLLADAGSCPQERPIREPPRSEASL